MGKKLYQPLWREFKTKKVGSTVVYLIPDDKKQEVFDWMKRGIGAEWDLEDEAYDLHEGKNFKVKDFLVIASEDGPLLVSPYYFESGGTLIDWLPLSEGEA